MYEGLVTRVRQVAEEVCDDYDVDPYIAEQRSFVIEEAADAIEQLSRKYIEERNAAVELTGELASKPRWIPVTELLPENDVHVLLSCKCGAGAYVCDGFHTEKYSTPTQFYEDIDADYDEETDEYYFPEG